VLLRFARAASFFSWRRLPTTSRATCLVVGGVPARAIEFVYRVLGNLCSEEAPAARHHESERDRLIDCHRWSCGWMARDSCASWAPSLWIVVVVVAVVVTSIFCQQTAVIIIVAAVVARRAPLWAMERVQFTQNGSARFHAIVSIARAAATANCFGFRNDTCADAIRHH
jgi:hypothetical protein